MKSTKKDEKAGLDKFPRTAYSLVKQPVLSTNSVHDCIFIFSVRKNLTINLVNMTMFIKTTYQQFMDSIFISPFHK